jgi:hypothetical protein
MAALKRFKEALGFLEYKFEEAYIPAVGHQQNYYLPVTIIKGPHKFATFSFENIMWHNLIQDGIKTMVATYDIKCLNPQASRIEKTKMKKIAEAIWVDYAAVMVENHNKIKDQILKDKTEENPDDEYRDDDSQEFAGPRGVRKTGDVAPVARVRSTQRRSSSSSDNQGLLPKVQPTTDKE